ncbi:hypothetical protein Saro_2670 [Novosphingobium aromaticivorans DSM 12444]|uniref:Uncharacterized protein n=1 Tax=Novosphingobium aromaticivorans (strain ATCC 700278 / DSM 12444 / CCUG 56034 / CIP 105152 / NBRC 16084 / F199) TaxID=279238 RepID=Q2G4W7_NOVAD|nr:hypothetical protein Saro_2670 [Novosphingobium aromaticivorans DSM 12444]
MSACAAPPVVPPAPPPPAPRPAAPPPPPAPAQSLKDWRDAPQTPGDWRFEMRAEGGIARFGTAQGTLFALSCNREARTITLVRTGSSAVSLPMTVATTSETRPLSAEPAPRDEPHLLAPLGLQDTLLDAMAFSRGRFLVEVNGLPTLYLPAWAEVGRVVEDCRGR